MTITKKHHHLHGGERWLLLCCAAEMYKWNLLMKLNIDKATLDFYYCFSIGSRVTTEDFDVTETSQDAIDTSHHSPFSVLTKKLRRVQSGCIPIIGSRLLLLP